MISNFKLKAEFAATETDWTRSRILKIIIFGLMLGLCCYEIEYLEYQQYLRDLAEVQDKIIFEPYSSNLTFWNYAVPIMIITIGFSIFTVKFLKYSEKIFSSILEGILLGLICLVFGSALTNFNYLIGYYFSGEYGSTYFRSLPRNSYPLDLILIAPLIKLVFDLVYPKVISTK